jgi:hypothetical protein
LNVEFVRAELREAGGLHFGRDRGLVAARREGAAVGGREQQILARIRRAGSELAPNQAADARRRVGRQEPGVEQRRPVGRVHGPVRA